MCCFKAVNGHFGFVFDTFTPMCGTAARGSLCTLVATLVDKRQAPVPSRISPRAPLSSLPKYPPPPPRPVTQSLPLGKYQRGERLVGWLAAAPHTGTLLSGPMPRPSIGVCAPLSPRDRAASESPGWHTSCAQPNLSISFSCLCTSLCPSMPPAPPKQWESHLSVTVSPSKHHTLIFAPCRL